MSAFCSALAKEKELEGKVFSHQDPFYDRRLGTYYSANAAQAPWCMVLPKATSDVSRIAQVLERNNCPFGMRSGAHSAFSGSNGVKDGVTVDFGHMNSTTYNKKTKIASIGPGADWGSVYTALEPYGVSAVGGRASVVGVAGFTTGGGYSFHTNSAGWACDNVANFEVVLYNGHVVNANSKDNANLWKALKGGSGNFGFVTRIDQHTVKGNQMWGGFVGYDQSKRDAVFKAYLNFAHNMDKDPYSQNIVALTYDKTGFNLRSILSNVQAKTDAPAFSEYFSIANTSSTLKVGSIADLVPQFTGPTPLGLYANWMVGQTASDFRIMDFIDKKHKEYTRKMAAAAPGSDFDVLVQFQPVTKSIVEHGLKNGGNSMGLEDVVADGPSLMWLIALTVDTIENQRVILPLALEYREAIDNYAKSLGLYKDWRYLNYAWKDQQPLSSHGKQTVKFLRSVSEAYDPHGVFQNLRKTGFKLRG
ncbi:FAD binding domain-containing protein [Colletotrichum navitas]|uniref:FAD binding domain-containing protein n=1 Tax=Colletotrichum navitas TaxID=681940 RepID=A0AAD8QBG2_9PEZI|nr:FAD binding domain-containing protein [Colletotrichum navitas]KAK1598886.1 FAD binding domain-containing protein [Colletotrichum navitas]